MLSAESSSENDGCNPGATELLWTYRPFQRSYRLININMHGKLEHAQGAPGVPVFVFLCLYTELFYRIAAYFHS